MTIKRLSDVERTSALAGLVGWTHEPKRDAIVQRFEFTNFVEAFAFVTRVALLAEKADHHPEWSNIYNRVDILLTTHDAGGLSQLDISLARLISTASRVGLPR